MPWNQARKKVLPSRKQKSWKLYGTVFGVFVLLLSVAVFFIEVGNKDREVIEKPTKAEKKTPKITKGNSHSRTPVRKKVPIHKMSDKDRLERLEKMYGTNIPENLKTTYYFLKNPPTTTYKPPKRREDIFKHHSERTIAAVILLSPGSFVLQRPIYDESFDMSFRKSLEEPTLFSNDDTPDERELKEAVNDVKAELAERMRNGEKPSEILTECMNTAYELGKYKRDIEELLLEIEEDPTKSNQDVEDFVNAANKMLRDKGAAELPMPTLFRRQARLKVLARQQQEKQQIESEVNQ